MNTLLDLINGISWSIVYTVAIILGVQHKCWYIPKLAICQNFAWELLVVINRIQRGSYGLAFWVQFIWLLLDVGVLITWLLYDRAGKQSGVRKAGLLFTVVAVMYLLAYQGGYWKFLAFLINAIMSAGFVLRTLRNDFHRESVLIAVAKLVGTLAATVLNGWIWWNPTVLWLGGLCFLLDGYYLISVFNKNGR